jgi:hypothetical protein
MKTGVELLGWSRGNAARNHSCPISSFQTAGFLRM